jgi:competence protein ComEC
LPLLWLSLAFLAGLVLATAAALPWQSLAGAAALCAVAAIFEQRLLGRSARYHKLRVWLKVPLSLMLAALLLGAMRQELARQPFTPSDLAWYNPQNDSSGAPAPTFRIRGVLDAEPDTGLRITLEIEARSIIPQSGASTGETLPVSGRLLVVVAGGDTLHYGDLVELTGVLEPLGNGQEDRTSQDSLARRGIFSIMYFPGLKVLQHDAGDPLLTSLYGLRQKARDTINAILPAPESGLLTGILLGIPNDMPQADIAAFQATGTAHIWAISGQM